MLHATYYILHATCCMLHATCYKIYDTWSMIVASWNVKSHEMSNVMKCQLSWNVKCHEMSNVMKWLMSWNVKESWNVKCHQMSMVTKCQMSWNADAGFMTPSRNTRSFTLRSVPSSPGRSFFIFWGEKPPLGPDQLAFHSLIWSANQYLVTILFFKIWSSLFSHSLLQASGQLCRRFLSGGADSFGGADTSVADETRIVIWG